jgi:hypothetical protein
MSTANLQSPRFNNVQIVTSIVTPEENNAGDDANAETPSSGMFLVPSTVEDRAADVTGFLVVSANELGKLEFADPDGFLALGDLSNVTLTAPVTGNVLTYNGTIWINSSAVAATTLTSSGATTLATAGTFSVFGEIPVAQQAAIVSPAADLAELKVAVDAIRAVLTAFGFTA